MRLQLGSNHALALAGLLGALIPLPAAADDRVDFTTTWYQEQRRGNLGGLTVIHPQLDVAVDLGESTELSAGYAADAVTGATTAVFQYEEDSTRAVTVDAVSSATKFEDLRHETRLGLSFTGSRSSLGLGGTVGVESDYASITVGGSAAVDLPGKNTNLALSYTHNFDEVCDRDNAMRDVLERQPLSDSGECVKKTGVFGQDQPGMTVWRDLDIDTVQATLTQNLTPTAVGQISLFGQVLQGFQSNPYRRVRVDASLQPQESVPDVRARAAVTARINRFFPLVRGAIHASVRGYSDTWGVNSGTAEMAYSQYAGNSLLLWLRVRIYQQAEATFFKDALFYQTGGAASAFFTGDRELSALRNILLSAKLVVLTQAEAGKQVWGVFDKVQVNLKGDILFLHELSDYGRQFLNGDQRLDAFTLQLGLFLAY